jgi:hypothetical protein
MYAKTTLNSPEFASQNGCSYRSGTGFTNGTLGPAQERFVNAQAEAAAAAHQRLVILTHHTGLMCDGAATTPLWNEVLAQLAPLARQRVLWYWGDEHMGVVYADRSANGVKIGPRCCGHGCIPWGVATGLASAAAVTWFERTVVGPGSNYLVANGYPTLALNGAAPSEAFYRQNGSRTWP